MPDKKTKKEKTKKHCTKQTTKKYKTRGSPPYSAADCPDKTQKGNDGTKYVSRPDKRGVYRWVQDKPVGLPKKRYVVHYNGNQPFVVYDDKDKHKATIYPQTFDEEKNTFDTVWTRSQVVPYKKLFAGERGTTVLLELTPQGQYMFVGGHVKTFTTPDKDVIRRFLSPVGNSDVPYPTAIGDKYVYFLLDDKYVAKEVMPTLQDDLYDQFYGFGKYADSGVQAQAKKLPSVRMKKI